LELPDNVFNVDITKMLKVLNYLAFPPLWPNSWDKQLKGRKFILAYDFRVSVSPSWWGRCDRAAHEMVARKQRKGEYRDGLGKDTSYQGHVPATCASTYALPPVFTTS
jgi:hypothetical protein